MMTLSLLSPTHRPPLPPRLPGIQPYRLRQLCKCTSERESKQVEEEVTHLTSSPATATNVNKRQLTHLLLVPCPGETLAFHRPARTSHSLLLVIERFL